MWVASCKNPEQNSFRRRSNVAERIYDISNILRSKYVPAVLYPDVSLFHMCRWAGVCRPNSNRGRSVGHCQVCFWNWASDGSAVLERAKTGKRHANAFVTKCRISPTSRFPFAQSGRPKRTGPVQFKGKVRGTRVHLCRDNSPNSRALADWSWRTERLWSMSRDILARTSSENLCVPFKNWLVGLDRWKATHYNYPFWPEPVLRTRTFQLRTDWSDRTDGKRPIIIIHSGQNQFWELVRSV